MIKTIIKLVIEGNVISLKRTSIKSLQPLKSKTLNTFILRSVTTQGCPLSSLLINIVLEVLASLIRQRKEIKCIQVGKKEEKLVIHR